MIEQLMVKNYILFDYALIDFSKGRSVITGETGAGKSLLIDAIAYLCGNRINSDIVRKGKDKCILQMVLSKPDDAILSLLEEDGFEIEDELIISRTITESGKSTIRLNQQATTAGFIKKLMNLLLDVHSQMDTYQLMNPSVQLELLDNYAYCDDLKEKVKKAYIAYKNIYFTYQYNEIVDMDIKENELEDLQQRIKEASQFQKSLEEYQNAIYLLDKDNGLLDQLYQLNKLVSKNKGLEEYDEYTKDTYYQYASLSESIKEIKNRYLNEVEDLDSMQEREYSIRKLFRKHGGSYEEMMKAKDAYMEKIDLILHRQDVFEKLEKQLKTLEKEYNSLSKQLHDQRCSVLNSLSTSIESHFKDLMLENARFKVDIHEKDYSMDGIDAIEFMVSMNAGQPFSSLKKSASGGELSRLMLALKVVFQSQNGIETIIFDEIDTGVSGKVAFAMGKKMHELSKNYQVLCITHLASVAAWANDHYCVEKMTKNDMTSTNVRELDEKETINQLAIMTTGQLSKESYNMALELKERCHG